MKQFLKIEEFESIIDAQKSSKPFRFIGKPIEIQKVKSNHIISIYFSVPFKGDFEFIQIKNIEDQSVVMNLVLNKTYLIYASFKKYHHKHIDMKGEKLIVVQFAELLDYNIRKENGFNLLSNESAFLSKAEVIELLNNTAAHELYYVYGLIDPVNNEIFYIGKGKGNRVFSHENPKTRFKNSSLKYIVLPRLAWDIALKYKIFGYNLSENDAFILEERIIKEIGRKYYDEGGTLINILEGGKDKHHKYLNQKRGNSISDKNEGSQIFTNEFEISGFYFLRSEIKNIVISDLKAGNELTLIPHPENKYDTTAIKVFLNNTQIGWVSKNYNEKDHLFNQLTIGKRVRSICSMISIKPMNSNSLPSNDNDLYTCYKVEIIKGKYYLEE